MKILNLLIIAFFTNSCSTQSQNLEVVAQLPKSIKESSACEVISGSNLVWTIEDQKNDNLLFGIDKQGNLQQAITITNVKNNDWEDLTSDPDGNLYIGDFGNNDNERKNLAIYKVNANDLKKNAAEASSIVEFYFPEQTEFPPKKKDLVYDVESFFYYNNKFYLFTKNRSSKFDGTTTLYRVDNDAGKKNAAKKIGSFVTCDHFSHCAVTSAAISKDSKKVALLSSDKVWIFTDFKDDNFFSGTSTKIELNHYTQKEGLSFESENSILITDEASKKEGSYLYRLKL